jgi:hypothetical protein
MWGVSFGHILAILGTVGCGLVVMRELQTRPIRLWRLFLMPLLVTLITLFLLIYMPPEMRHPSTWGIVLLIGILIGVGRGLLMRLQVDHMWALIRIPRPRDTLIMLILVAVLVLGEIASALAGPAGGKYHPLLTTALILCAGFCNGRALTAALRIGREPHFELRRP